MLNGSWYAPNIVFNISFYVISVVDQLLICYYVIYVIFYQQYEDKIKFFKEL